MELSTLRLFMEVMRQHSFSEVARAHGIAPSSVSRAIAGLEDELDIRLFQRSTRRLEPTEAGMLYFERISAHVDELDAAHQIAVDVSEEPRGTLRVTASTVFGQTHIVDLLPEFAERYPSLSVELLLTDAYLDLIEERIDVSVRLGKLEDSAHIARRLAGMAFFICASPEYLAQHGTPTTAEQVRDHHCLRFPRAGHNLNWLFRDKNGNLLEIPIAGHYLITNSQAIKQCTLNSMGLSLLPDWLVREEIADGRLIRLFSDYEVTATDYESAIWLLYPSREYLPLKVRVFVDFLSERLFGNP